MRVKIALLLVILGTGVYAQKNKTVDLRWKIAENEEINYQTVMDDIDTATIEFDFGGLFGSFMDSTAGGIKKTKNFFEKLNEAYSGLTYVTTLTSKKEGVVEIEMTTRAKEEADENESKDSLSKEEELIKMMGAMNQGVVLRGSVYNTGDIHSFWVKSNQKNLIALFFQLPNEPVKIGDKWDLEISFIGNDQNFKCDSSFKVNEVTLVDVKKVKGETIAVLKYNIVEYVSGDFKSPSFFSDGGTNELMMKFSHQGVAEFSIDQGRWLSYDGIMSYESTGFMNASQKKKFTLILE